MSGIEVAGLILGALPLIIAALENYNNGLTATMAFLRWKGQLAVALQSLWYQQTSYELSIRLLLDPITTDQDLQMMLADSHNALWQSREISNALQHRLGDAYMGYMETVRSIERTTKLIAENLSIKGSNEVTQKGLAALLFANQPSIKNDSSKYTFQSRVKFTMSRKTVQKLLAELEVCNRRLDSYATKAERLERPYRVRRVAKFSILPHLIEQDATRIYHTISQLWCASHAKHQTGLLLEQRLDQKQRGGKGTPIEPPRFSSGRCYGISLFQSVAPVRWLDTEFHVLDCGSTPSLSKRNFAALATPPSSQSVSRAIDNSLRAAYDPSKLPVVTDLCAAIKQPPHAWPGFCLDTKGSLRGSYLALPRVAVAANDVISLAGMLGQKHDLSMEEIYSLSVTLSSSLLQLNRTPWLSHSWTKSDLLFLRAKNDSLSRVDFKHPYLTTEHINGAAVASVRRSDSSNVLALAVLLVEIHSGQPIESLRRPQDMGADKQPNEFTDLQVVHRWANEKEKSGNLTLGFRLAISHCLKCFVDSALDLTDATSRAKIEEQVLSPLQDEMSFLFG